jgi:hypothetical protein
VEDTLVGSEVGRATRRTVQVSGVAMLVVACALLVEATLG